MMAGIASHGLAWPSATTADRRPIHSGADPWQAAEALHWQAGKLAQGTGPLSGALGDLTIFNLTGHATRCESGLTGVVCSESG
jgi:hypothetical protein